MSSFFTWFTNLYPVWIVLSSIVGFIHPPALAWFTGSWVTLALTLVMLGMGFTLTIDDFKRLFKMPAAVAIGCTLQYTVMPLSAWFIAKSMNLAPGFAVGLILLASCPGGTASNLITYLARANVALSVVMTLVSTMIAFIMTPLWCQVLAGQYVAVDVIGLSLSTFKVVVLPVLIGVFCNYMFPQAVKKIAVAGPIVSVVAIIFIAGGIVAQSADAVAANAGKLAIAATLLHGLGYLLGHTITRLFRYPADVARTISIEVGMQNAGMAVMLQKNHFAHDPMVAVPSVFSSVLQTVIGSILAAIWRSRMPEPAPPPAVVPASDHA
ncbi:bile acid:sodium symporter family protein [Phragmitibacter flavus]|uniref:Bile acid:sodium symporter family protein n=1 Tax=Phragmitibacter flavus TaxID=2576071 RepID=A0A5R8K7P4_9BACT|nr:bile acid:sodium symporter family protein [Phragmitibacter flavus]TLD68363.1 bile acid:sodium symporter family protein [Phragmitibacter flavus]